LPGGLKGGPRRKLSTVKAEPKAKKKEAGKWEEKGEDKREDVPDWVKIRKGLRFKTDCCAAFSEKDSNSVFAVFSGKQRR